MKRHNSRIGLVLLLLALLPSVVLSQLPCGQNISFSTWTQEGSPSSGQWIVNTPGNSVTQTLNGTSTWFVSPNDYFNVLIQGSIQVNTSNDDDLVGFVFGYQNPIGSLTNPSSTYLKSYFFDWKQLSQTFVGLTSNEGYALYEMDGFFNFNNIVSSGGGMVFPELWQRTNSPNLNLLSTNYGNNGWNDFQQYDFQLKYTADSIVIWIDDIKIFEESGCYEPGKFGFYNQSQDNVIYSNFSYSFEYDFTIDDSLICENDFALFQIGSGCTNFFPSSTSFSWDFGDGTTGQGQNPSHQYTTSGIFDVQLVSTDQFGCVDTCVRSLQVSAQPIADAGSDDFSCTLSYPLSAGNPNGTWTSLSGTVLSSPNFPNCSVTVPNEGSYSFVWTAINLSGCNSSDTVTITFSQLDATSALTHPSCSNSSNGQITLFPQGGLPPYTYQWSASTGNQTTINASNLSGGNYSILMTDSQGCTFSEIFLLSPPMPITFNPLITPSNCDVNNGQISISGIQGGTGPYSFDWGAGSTTTNTLQNLPGGSYSVIITDANNCDTSVTLTVSITPLLAQVTSLTDVTCFGYADGVALVSGPTPQVPYTYQWTTIIGTPTAPTVTNLSAGTYPVIVSYSPTCSDTLLVQISEPPPLQISLISDTFICDGASINLFTNSSGGTPGYEYNWNHNLGNGQNHLVSPIQNTTYTCSSTDANGCSITDSVSIEIISNPIVSFLLDTNQACLLPEYDFSFYANSSDSLVSFNWDFGDGTFGNGNITSHHYSSSGSYTVTLHGYSPFGCENQTPVQSIITVHQNPIADFVYSPNNPTTLFPTVNFIDLSVFNVTNWYWSFGNSNSSIEQNPTFTFPGTVGTHEVLLEVENEYSCTDSISKLITIHEDILFYAPNSFTPDNDEHNQSWSVVMQGIDIQGVEISIFNRWGELIWFSQNLEVSWDGTYNGRIVPDGVYIWTVKAKDSFTDKKYEFTGHVNVLR